MSGIIERIQKIKRNDFVKISNPGKPTDNKVGKVHYVNPYKMTSQVRYRSNDNIHKYQENRIKFERLTVITEDEYNKEMENFKRTPIVHLISENGYPEKSDKPIVVFKKVTDGLSEFINTRFIALYGFYDGENFVDNESNIITDVFSWKTWEDSVKELEKNICKDFMFKNN